MSNPTSVVTERRLGEFYQEILPYLGGSADAGFTPVGSVIAIMGVTAPANYLACDGTVYNISDYPELANYFYQQFGSKNKFGGDGTTTFAVPDLRGEFLRGTGTNSHSGNGNGATVGTHQDSTQLPQVFVQSTKNTQVGGTSDDATASTVKNNDGTKTASFRYNEVTATSTKVNSSGTLLGVRPTNTSILWCIATKDIYLNSAMDYSTSEKVVGKWIDGKTLYQKTVTGTIASGDTTIAHNINNIENVCNVFGYLEQAQGYHIPTGFYNGTSRFSAFATQINIVIRQQNYDSAPFVLTIQYTKTT